MSKNGGGYGGASATLTAAAAAVAAISTGTPVSNSTHWSTEETKLLIRTWGGYREEFAEIKRNLVVWNKVLERLLSAGFFRTVEQCRNRWKFLETKYKTAARDMNSAGNTAWEFFDDMDFAKRGTTRRRNSSASSAGMHRHLYESPSQSPSQQNSTLPASSSQPLAGAQTQKPLALFADPYGRVMLPPIRPTAAVAPPVASADSARSVRHSSPALPAAASSSQHSRVYQPRQDSPSAHYTYHQNKSSSSDNSCPTHSYPPSQLQYYEAVATFTPQPPPQRLSPHMQQQLPQRQQQLNQQARQYRPPAGRGPPSQVQQQFNSRRPVSPLVTYSHHPLAAGHLPESHPSTPNSASTSASADTHSYQPQAPLAMSMRPHMYPTTHGNAAYSRAYPGPTELRTSSARTGGSILQAKLGQDAIISAAQRPSSAQPPADTVAAQHDVNWHRWHRALSADTGLADAPMPRKRKLERTSLLLASNNSEADHDDKEHGEGSAANKAELVGTISRADLLGFLREQSQQRQQHESLRAEERRRSEDIRREEEWRFHEYQMSLMQLIQNSLAPFAVDDDGDFEKCEHVDMAQILPAVSPRPSGQMEVAEGGVDSRASQVFPVVEFHATGASAQNPVDKALACKAGYTEEVEMRPRTPLPVANDLGASTSSPFLPQAEPSLA
ncbi:hypothetical protein IW152_000694 [Coemansia sp. BCRC 34962]|nr:hypothetical protein IW152_000694 [Coemansia sp. BCRC 34962]